MRSAVRAAFLRADRGRRGGALAMALVTVLIVSGLSASFLGVSSIVTKNNRATIDRERAFYLAEAGIAEAYSGIVFGKSGRVGSQERPAVLGEGLFWVEVRDLGDKMVQLESTGMCGLGTATIEVVLERGAMSVASLGVFSSEDLVLPEGTQVDAFDSGDTGRGGGRGGGRGRRGGRESSPAMVGSNGTVTVRATEEHPTKIDGDVVPGKDEALVLDGEPTITGATSPRYADAPLPKIETPKLDSRPGFEHRESLPLMVRSGEFGYEYARVASGSELILTGPMTLVVDELSLAAGGTLRFDTSDGPVKLYVEESLNLESGSFVSTSSEVADDAWIYLPNKTDEVPARLHAEGSFYGVVYAPEAQVDVGPSFELFGALVADQLHLPAGGRLHFDRHLGLLAEEIAAPSFIGWRLQGFDSPVPGAAGQDPFTLLGVQRDSLPLPADAHEDQVLVIVYYDYSGVLQRYDGLESNFDWSDVDVIVGGWRDGQVATLTGSTGTVLVR